MNKDKPSEKKLKPTGSPHPGKQKYPNLPTIRFGEFFRMMVAINGGVISGDPAWLMFRDPLGNTKLRKLIKETEHTNRDNCLAVFDALDLLENPAVLVGKIQEDPLTIYSNPTVKLAIITLAISTERGSPVPEKDAKVVLRAAHLDGLISSKSKRWGPRKTAAVAKLSNDPEFLKLQVKSMGDYIRKFLDKRKYTKDFESDKTDGIKRAFHALFGPKPFPKEMRGNPSITEVALKFVLYEETKNLSGNGDLRGAEVLRKAYRSKPEPRDYTLPLGDCDKDTALCVWLILTSDPDYPASGISVELTSSINK